MQPNYARRSGWPTFRVPTEFKEQRYVLFWRVLNTKEPDPLNQPDVDFIARVRT